MIQRRKVQIAFCLSVTLIIYGCFPFGNQERTIAGDYRLVQFEDGETYYIYAEGQNKPGGGVIDGTVKRIGWNYRYIIVWQHSNFRGDPDGWMIINHQNRTIKGPFSDQEIAGRKEISSIDTMSPEVAWEKL
ncbi:MAG: hypothetical protein SWH78_17830 [Thermodesulfobacteriota bacterium]|nr:hypothetical protein [Thermodesulfobacteriota bacterium]